MFLDDTSCNLGSINVFRFLNDDNTFDTRGYIHAINLGTLILEASIIGGMYPTKDIARKTYMFRTLGLGMTDFATLAMVLGVPYDSDEARNLVAGLFSLLTGQGYYVSSLMAKKTNPFEMFEINKPYMMRVIKNHAIASNVINERPDGINYDLQYLDLDIVNNYFGKEFVESVKNGWLNSIEYGDKFGFKNAQISVSAPTGSLSFVLGASTPSIEPAFAHIIFKRLVGGGFMTITNPNLDRALHNLGYTNEQISDIKEYMLANGGAIEFAPHIKEEDKKIFDTANKNGKGERCISPEGHYKLVASITPMLSGAASKTVNLSKGATYKEVADVYLQSWKLGVKGITVYIDMSKAVQPMNLTLEEDMDNQDLDKLPYDLVLEYAKKAKKELSERKPLERKKPFGIRKGVTHYGKIEDVKIYVTINKDDDGNINEVYISSDKVGSTITGLLNSISKTISTMIQHGISAKDISKMYRGASYTPSGFVQNHPYIKNCSSISDFVSRCIDIELGDYRFCQVKPDGYDTVVSNTNSDKKSYTQEEINNGEKLHGRTCSVCGGDKIVQIGTCTWCMDCNESSGCS